ncbi:MAG: BTAD domain-containing putative transcriptional regulator, partial [Chloroflexota bacterium]
PKSYALLYYTLTAQHSVQRRELGALLWPDSKLSAARHNLRNHLTAIRTHLGAHLTITSDSVTFDRTPNCDSDIDQFVALEQKYSESKMGEIADMVEARRVLCLYRGDFLAGFTVSYSDVFNDWVDKTREEMSMQFSHLLYKLSQTEAQQGNVDDAIADVDRLVAVVPWHEGGHRLKMKLLAEQGERWAALEQYATLTDVLQKELDVTPDEETEQLVARIRQGLVEPAQSSPAQTGMDAKPIAVKPTPRVSPPQEEPSPASTASASTASASTASASTASASTASASTEYPATRHFSPVPLTPLLGHGTLLAEATTYLKSPAHRLVTLLGMGGVGKSHMALTLGHMLADDFEHGVCFVPLAGIAEPEGEASQATQPQDTESELVNRFVMEVATALQLPLGSSDEVVTQLTNYLRRRTMLLIIDNFEHVWKTRSQLTALLKNAPNCTALVTSRTRLQLPSETIVKVDPLAIPALDEVEDALRVTQDMTQATDPAEDRYAALQLFIDRARRYNPAFRLYRENFADLIQVCHQTGGLPLALEMVASWTEHFTVRQITEQLAQDHRTLLQGVASDLAEHTSIDALFDHSWRFLDEAAQQSFLHISHFVAAFDQNAANTIAGVTLFGLKQLTDTSFLQLQSAGRYTLHPLVQRFAQTKWHEQYGQHSPESERFWQAYCAYYLAFLSEHVEKMNGDEGPRVMTELRQEQDHIALAWQQTLNRNDADLIGTTLEAFTRFYMRNGAYEQLSVALNRLENRLAQGQLLASTDNRYTPLAFRINLMKSEVSISQYRLKDALVLLTDTQLPPTKTISERHLIYYYLNLAFLLSENGDFTEAKGHLDRAAELLSDEIPPGVHGDYHFYMAEYWLYQGDLERGAHHMALTLDYRRADGDHWNEPIILRVMTFYLHPILSREQVSSNLQKALTLIQQTENRYGEARIRNAFVSLSGYRDQVLRIEQLQKAIEVYSDIGNETSIYTAIRNLYWEYLCLGQYPTAQRLQATLLSNQEKVARLTQYLLLINASILHRVQGETTKAVEVAQTLVAMHPTIRPNHHATGFVTLGYAYLNQAAFIEAVDAFSDALNHIQTHKYPASEIYPRAGLAEVAYQQQDYETALREVELILPMLDEDGNQRETTEPLRPYWVCYQVLKVVDDPRAPDLLTRSYDFLMRWADALDNEEWRRSFVEDVRVNRRIVEEWKG